MKKPILLIISLFAVSLIYAQTQTMKNLDFVKKLSKETSQAIADGDFATAADYIEPYWPMSKTDFEKFQSQATKSFKAISQGLGKSFGSTKINEQNLGDVIFREVYFIQYEESPLRIEYIYYKTQEGWIINGIKWDDQFELEFD